MTQRSSSSRGSAGHRMKKDGEDVKKSTEKRPQGRPLLSFAELAARKAARASKPKWRNPEGDRNGNVNSSLSTISSGTTPSKRQNGASLIERLPVELLERIFLYAVEPNFCRASPYLASAVSSERIYRTLIRLAFFRDDDDSETWTYHTFGKRKKKKSGVMINANARERIAEALAPADYGSMWLDDTERTNLQDIILRCRWCTKQRIQNQLRALMQMTIQRHWVGANIVIADPVQQASLNNLLQLRDSGGATNKDAPPASTTFQGTARDGKTYDLFIIPLVSISIMCPENFDIDVYQVLNLRVIPDYLLRGRRCRDGKGWFFAEEDIDLLEMFRLEYRFDGTSHNGRFSRDALHAGIRTALNTRNARALTTLLKADESITRRRLENESELSGSGSGSGSIANYSSQSQGMGQYYSIPADFFVEAVKLPMPEAVQFFKLLMRCNAESIPPDSSEITQWAMELSSNYYLDSNDNSHEDDTNEMNNAEERVAFGRWLLDFMIDLPRVIDEARENPREKGLFYCGRVNRHFSHRMGRRFLAEVCTRCSSADQDEWKYYWTQKLSYDVSKTWTN